MNERVLAVQRMQDYIEANISEEITPAGLAAAALYSPWYSYRIFRELTGLTPADYIRRLRLSKSALRLKNSDCRIAEVAFEMGFGSVDGYQRAFYREFGMNPGEYARAPVPVALFIPYGVKFRELRKEDVNMDNVRSVFVQQVKKPRRKVIIKRGIRAEDYFAYCGEVGCDVWGSPHEHELAVRRTGVPVAAAAVGEAGDFGVRSGCGSPGGLQRRCAGGIRHYRPAGVRLSDVSG